MYFLFCIFIDFDLCFRWWNPMYLFQCVVKLLISIYLGLDLSGWRIFNHVLYFFFLYCCIDSWIENPFFEISIWTPTCLTFLFLVLILKGEFLFSCLIPRWCDKLRFMTLIYLHRNCEITFHNTEKLN